MESTSSPFEKKGQSVWKDLIWLILKLRGQNQPTGTHSDAASVQNNNHDNPQNFNATHNQTQKGPGAAKTTLQFIIALLIAIVPISFYLLQPNNFENAISAVKNKVKESAENALSANSSAVDDESERLNAILNDKVAQLQLDDNNQNVASERIPSESIQDALGDSAMEHAGKHANPNYICPMHPDVISDDANAICPICGMDLVLLETGGETGVVKLKPAVINALGVRTSKVKRRTLYRRIDSVGYIDIDENNIREISLRTEGWVERLAYKSAGERVTKGELLLEIYSPKLVNAQEEYVQAKLHKNKMLLAASEERLRALGVSEEQIFVLDETKIVDPLVKIYAPQSGIISQLNVREGRYVKPSQSVIDLVDLSSVWLMVDVFERQADWVKEGQRAEVKLPFLPGKSWEGTVEHVYPTIDASSRSLKVRLRFENVNEDLKPNMYADVTIFAKPKKKVISIPKEALIRTGKNDRVIVAMGEGRFIPMPVRIGMETDTRVEIISGLGEGDEVVTSSQFLIDSESSLKASLARMSGGM